MKKAAILAAALAMVLTLAACGSRDDNDSNNRPNDNTVTDNGGVNGSNSGRDDPITGGSSGTTNGGMTNGNNGTSNGGSTANGSGTGSNDPITGSGSLNDGSGVTGNSSAGRSSVGNDLRRAADDVGDAVTGMVDGARSAVTRGTSTTTFQRMLDNARVHDTDGVLADGENSRW